MRILLTLLLLTSFASAIVFAQDEPTSEQDSWITTMWNAHKGLITLGGVIAFIVLAIVFARYESVARAGRMEAYAQKHGWGFVRRDNGELDTLMESLCPGRKYYAYNVRQVQARNPRVLMFEITYQDPNSVRAKPLSATACLAELSRKDSGHSGVVIYPTVHFDFTSDKIDLGDKAFAEEFTVASADSATAMRMVSVQLRQALLEDVKRDGAVPIRFEIYPGHLLAVTESLRDLTKEEDMDRMLALTQEVAQAVNAQ